MNRLPFRSEKSAPNVLRRPDRPHGSLPRPTAIAPSLFVPLHYEPNYAYPLVVWLHGPGDNERQLQRIMPHLSLRNYVAVSPRGTSACEAGSAGAFAWQQTEVEIAQAEARVLECLELAKARCHIHAERIFLAGYQCGGSMALRIGLKYPEIFAGVISMSGPFPSGFAPLSRLKSVRRLPLMITYGRDEGLYSSERICQDLHLFHTAGLAVHLRQYPCADEMTTKMLADANAWLMERVTGLSPMEDSVTCTAERDLN